MHNVDLTDRPSRREELGAWYAATLAEQESSGLSVAEFAEELGVTPTTLYQWRRRLSARAAEERRRQTSPKGLVEVTVDNSRLELGDAERFIVRLRAERSIEVPRTFDDTELRRVVTVIESC